MPWFWWVCGVSLAGFASVFDFVSVLLCRVMVINALSGLRCSGEARIYSWRTSGKSELSCKCSNEDCGLVICSIVYSSTWLYFSAWWVCRYLYIVVRESWILILLLVPRLQMVGLLVLKSTGSKKCIGTTKFDIYIYIYILSDSTYLQSTLT